jgi:uncharacterized protein (DUF362 family)
MAYDALGGCFTNNAKAKRILLKPNIGRNGPANRGLCTNPEVIRGAVRFFKEAGANVLVGDGAIWGVDFWQALESAGIRKMADEEGVTCVNLDEAPPVTRAIPGGIMVDKLRFSSLPFEVDLVVSIPVMKTHMYTGATLSIKNMKGCLYKMEKTKLHRINRPCPDLSRGRCLDYGIADMTSVLLPGYALLDGTICMQGFGPSAGDPISLDLVVAGKDPLAADLAGVRLMGLREGSVAHLGLVAERLGWAPGIEVDPPDYEKYGKTFATADMAKLAVACPNLTVIEKGSCSACSAAIMAFIKNHGPKFTGPQSYTLETGKDLSGEDLCQENAVLIGNCAGECGQGVSYCKGCPPVASAILSFIRNESEDDYEARF